MIKCRDLCGASQVDEDAALASGWSFLSISKNWRCASCVRALDVAAQYPGTPAQPGLKDPLAPDSRGALPKATAETISAPVVPHTIAGGER